MNISCKSTGYIITNDNDTIRGKFLRLDTGSPEIYSKLKNISIFTEQNDEKLKVNISLNRITKMGIVNNRKKDTTVYTYYNNYFWQLLATQNNLDVYLKRYSKDAGYSLDTYYTSYGTEMSASSEVQVADEDVVIFSNKTQVAVIYSGELIDKNDLHYDYIYSGSIFQKSSLSSWAQQILQFINTRYKLNLTDNR